MWVENKGKESMGEMEILKLEENTEAGLCRNLQRLKY